MGDKGKTLIRMFAVYGKMDILWVLRDTKYCLLYMFSDLVSAAASAAGVFLLAVRFDGISGMSRPEILFMLGYGMLADGVFMLFFLNQNTGRISRVIGRGQLDHNLIQPVPLWIQLVTSGFAPASGSSVLFGGLALLLWAIRLMGLTVSFGWILGLLVSVICSVVIVLSAVYGISCIAFYAPAAAEEIAEAPHDLFAALKTFPLGGLAGPLKLLFCSVVPVGLAAWFPSLVLIGKTPAVWSGIRFPALTMTMAAVFLWIAICLFKKGMRYYAKYGSPRYSGFGHR